MNYFNDLTLQRVVVAERSASLQRDADLSRLRRLLRRRSRAERRLLGAPRRRPAIALREHAIERNIMTAIEPQRHQAA